MKILLPFQKDSIPYLEEILKHTSHSYVFKHYSLYDHTYKVVNIHWPEALFDWYEPTSAQLDDLETAIKNWKENSLIVYTKHDVSRHKGMTPLFTRLFNLIEHHTDVFIHLGEYSKNFYKQKYPKAFHEVVRHPLFTISYQSYSKFTARKRLNIAEDALVVIAPGKIRTFKERDLILRSFKGVKFDKKVLIVPNMRTELRYDFRGRVWLKRFFNLQKYFINNFKNRYQPPGYMFTYEKLSADSLALKIAASDIVLVPRLNILNSGNVFLGLTFQKIVVGPAIGNIEEHLKLYDMPVFDPESISSVIKALEKGFEDLQCGYKPPQDKLNELEPENIARKLDAIFNRLVDK